MKSTSIVAKMDFLGSGGSVEPASNQVGNYQIFILSLLLPSQLSSFTPNTILFLTAASLLFNSKHQQIIYIFYNCMPQSSPCLSHTHL